MSNKILNKCYFKNDNNVYEIGIDEAGRGPLFGRVYASAVILPKNDNFRYELIKDSKKFTSYKNLSNTAKYIKENAIKWAVAYCDENEIDNYNIRKATHKAMHKAIKILIEQFDTDLDFFLLVDGIDFTDMTIIKNDTLQSIDYSCIKGGDNLYYSIAAASIIAKYERDKYIYELCEIEPVLHEKYHLKNNKGYGTKKHIDGIKKFGISNYHRKTFGICKSF
jgi:ribonuclease HII